MIWLIFLPIINFLLQYHFSKVSKTLKDFKKHWICYRWDRYFIIINTIFGIFFISIDKSILLWIFILSLIGNTIMHRLRYNNIQYNNYYGHLFQKEWYRLSKAGIIHLIFSIIESIIITLWLFWAIEPHWDSILKISIALFSCIILFGWYQMNKLLWEKIHKKLDRKDLFIAILLIIISIIRIITV